MESWNKKTNRFMKKLRAAENFSEPDYETFLHQDTFYPTFKAWLYIKDVTIEDGPFVYTKSTNRLDFDRFKYEYHQSTKKGAGGSWRADQEIIRKSKKIPEAMICKQNTLILANTYGWHARKQIEKNHERHAIHLSIRSNPWMFF